MTPKPIFRRVRPQYPIFPHLHLLRLLLGILLILSFIPLPSLTLSTLLRKLSPALLPFLIFLSAFSLTYFPRPLLHRLLTLIPLHLFSTLIHLPNPYAFTDAFLLSPFLPAYSLPSSSPPTPAPTLLPSLIILSFLHPALTSLLPRPANPRHIAALLTLTWLATLLQALWFTHLPNTLTNPRSTMLFDIASYFPFLLHLPSYIAGMLLANLRCAARPTIHPAFPAILLLSPLRVFLSDIPITLRAWLSTGALLPPFALLVYSLTRLSITSSATIPYTRVSLTAFSLAVPIYSVLSTFCNHHNKLCVSSLHIKPDQLPLSQLEAAVYRLLHPVTFPTPVVRPTIYLPVLILTSLILHLAVVHPLTTFLQTLAERLTPTSYSPRQPPPKPNRSITQFQRITRLCIYYTALVAFIAFTFHFSVPITRQLASRHLPSLLCYLPRALYKCDIKPQPSMLQGLLAKIGLGSGFLTAFADAFRWVSLLTLPTMVFNLVGHIIFPRAVWRQLPSVRQMLDDPVGQDGCFEFVIYFRYVTRGNNPRLVASNAFKAAEVLMKSGLPKHRWCVEVVTDRSMNLNDDAQQQEVYEIVVPKEYVAPNGAMYKARALNYAIGASPAREDDWIVHLDEETRFDVDTVRGILHHCLTETHRTNVMKCQEWPRIGQGPILYGRALIDEDVAGADAGDGNWLTTLADSGRVSDDCGRYRFQYECGEVWVGMHGSFVVACNKVEQAVTFDHGEEGSIAEDAFFAMIARSKNVRFSWIDALMFEQSPFTVMDFVKQRARWLVGGLRVVWSSRIPWHLRSLMGTLTALWALMPVMYMSLIFALLFGSGDSKNGANNVYYHVLLPLLAAMSLWNYAFGFFVTFSLRRLGLLKFLVVLYAQLALTPIFGVMEVAAVTYALWNFTRLSVGFHVVTKEGVGKKDKGKREDEQDLVDEQTSLV